MEPKNKAIIAFSAALTVILLLLLISVKYLVLNSYLALEEEDAKEHLQRVDNALESELDSLESTAGDYAAWDDSYRFMHDANPEYVASNLSEYSLSKLRVDLVVFVRNDGGIIHANALKSRTGAGLSTPDWLANHLEPSSPLRQCNAPGDRVRGVIVIEGAPYLISARPVLTNDMQGPVIGSLIMGRKIDSAELSRMQKFTRLPLDISVLEPNLNLPVSLNNDKPLSLENRYAVKKVNVGVLNGYALVGDIYRRPALLVKAKIERDIYRSGVKTSRYFMAWAVVISILSIIVLDSVLARFDSTKRNIEAERLNFAAMQGMACGVILLESESFRIVQVNPAFAFSLGYSPERLCGVLLRELFADIGDFAVFMASVQSRARAELPELRLLNNDRSAVAMTADASRAVLDGNEYDCLLLRVK
ncbi:CHASE4 domain protein [Geobacter sp. OR-1]|uniref:CHASE4 domain-containing protein n=1 Tax=Geobacter sp. OR-1 TaxID=1266765 RepID=UPI000541DFA7|nr:CHASE4 domain-containing protein [Geobacter sp. OR-1]GAM09059.1 CHASE4 domain protein [Geobacter sp. OR-1]